MTEDITKRVKGLERALKYGGETHTIFDVFDSVESGRSKLWVEEGATIVTEVFTYPQSKTLHFWLATGELDTVIDLSERIIEEARQEGCDRATLSGRMGWLRALKDHGWSRSKTVHMERSLTWERSPE